MGKVSSDTRFGGGPPKNGGDVSGKGVGNRRETVKPYVAKNGRKVGNYVKEGNNNLGGSRFAVLSEEVLEGPTGKNGLHIPKKHPLVPVTAVLAEISNKIGNRMKLVPSTTNKYLVIANTDKSHHSVSSKENRGGGITSKCTIGSNKGKQTNVKLEEDLEDSEGSSSSSVIFDGSVDLVPAQLVDVSAAKDLEVVALNLSEAMEVALE
ncbi:hypothetical protein Q3G72_009095 [Acer saccharum]|nr:hypothetical protein Q3G72_009095 [Acer saccharum]